MTDVLCVCVCVHMQGGYMAAKVSKLEEQFMRDAPREKEKQGTSSSIFSGVAIYVNGYTGQIKHCLLYGVQLAKGIFKCPVKHKRKYKL